MMSDRIGRRRAMVWGTFGSLLAVVAVAWGSNAAVLVVAVILMAWQRVVQRQRLAVMMENSGERERTALFSTSFGLSTLAALPAA